MSDVAPRQPHFAGLMSWPLRLAGAIPSIRASIRPHPAHWQATKGAAVLMALGLALGLLIAAQMRSQPAPPSQATESSRQTAASTIERLEADQSDLKKQIAQLRADVAARQQNATANKSVLAGLQEDLKKQQIAAGMVALKGPGVRVVLDDSAATTVPADEDPSFYLVHEYHLRDVANLLWRSGAEAISINGERLVGTTSIYCVGSTIMVNDTRMSPPFEITAIGNPGAMEQALNDPANLRTFKVRVKVYGVQFHVATARDLNVPAYNGSLEIKAASADVGSTSGARTGE